MNRKSAKTNTLDISLTDMLHANDGEFATIKSPAGLSAHEQ